jgi:hypothetical protein
MEERGNSFPAGQGIIMQSVYSQIAPWQSRFSAKNRLPTSREFEKGIFPAKCSSAVALLFPSEQ